MSTLESFMLASRLILLGIAVTFIGWCVWSIYKACTSRDMATRIRRKPVDDDRSSQRNFKRMMRP